ncbi:hypothetical protein CLOM_g22216 [Closterium sp. NIES-68]|nr:hypothetical protein CLOM_g22216 [Closterium sp. NIES-68]
MLVSLINHLFSHTSTRVQLSQFPLHYSKSQVSTSWDLVSAKDPKGFSQPNNIYHLTVISGGLRYPSFYSILLL